MITNNVPVKLIGAIHTPVWSGNRLSEIYAAYSEYDKIGEVHMTSPDAKAVYCNEKISFGEYITRLGLPLPPLVKLLDAASPLSVQVHPDSDSARKFGGVSKTETWYVLAADLGSSIMYGTRQGVSLNEIKNAIICGDIEPLLEQIMVSVGDIYHIPPGMIHSLGGGITVLEVQDRPGTTYRVKDITGNREIHPRESAESAHLYVPGDLLPSRNAHITSLPGDIMVAAEGYTLTRCTAGDTSQSLTLSDSGVYMFCEKGGGSSEGVNFAAGDSLFFPRGMQMKLEKGATVFFVK